MTVTESPSPPRPPIDPRLRARRIAVRRDEGRRRLHRLIGLGVAAALLVLAFAVTRSPLLDVDHLTVTGATHESVDAVVSASGLRRHQPMTAVDLDRARRGVAALPWIATVSVQRHWPATIVIRVTERVPVAAVANGPTAYGVVDADGRVLEVDPAPPAGHVVITGIPPTGPPGTTVAPEALDALSVARSLTPSLAPKIASVVVAPDGVRLQLAGKGVVVLGPATDLPAKVLAASTVLAQVPTNKLCTLDVRVPSAPSLTQGSPCA